MIPQAIIAASDVTQVDPCCNNQKTDEDLMLGTPLSRYMVERQDDLEGTQDQKDFYSNVREFLVHLVIRAKNTYP